MCHPLPPKNKLLKGENNFLLMFLNPMPCTVAWSRSAVSGLFNVLDLAGLLEEKDRNLITLYVV